MSAARKMDTKRDPIAEAAKRALDKAGGDVREAAGLLETAVRQSRQLRDSLTEPLISGACYDAVRQQMRVTRAAVWRSPPTDPIVEAAKGKAAEQQTARVIRLATGTLLMFPLPGGKRLADAKRSDITEAADFYATQSADMAIKARWLRLVAQSVPANKTVGQALTDKRLRELQREAQADAAD